MDFSDFYFELHPRLVATLAAVSGDGVLAADAADEASARALQQWSKVSAMSNPHGWVYRVALNELRRKARRQQIEASILRRTVTLNSVSGPSGEIWHLVAELPARQRESVVLRHLAQLTEPEIADVMGVKRGTISSTLRAAHANLRVALQADDLSGRNHR